MFDQTSSVLLASLPDFNITIPGVGVFAGQVYLAAGLLFVGLTIGFWVLRIVVVERLKAWSGRTKTDLDDVIVDAILGIRSWVYTLIALYAALQFFTLPEPIALLLAAAFYFAVVWQLIEIALRFLNYGTIRWLRTEADEAVDPNAATAANMVVLITRLALWTLGGLFVLSNLGIEVTSLIAGLGIGGIAVAFALQGILSDLFASFSIYFDRPFRIGDFIIIGTDMGVVEKIGIKSTRLRTLQGEELVISNAELTTARVQNFKKMQERRIVAQFGVTYETPAEKLLAIPTMVTEIFETIADARLDRVHFATFGDFALIYEVVYHVTSPDYNTFMDIQQTYNFALLERFADASIEFAYPTQTVFTKSLTASK